MNSSGADLLAWKKSYETGIEEIDLQHHYFLTLINKLNQAFGQDHNEIYLHRLLEELIHYAQFHFISEENMMFAIGYPQLKEHSAHHSDLIDRVRMKSNLVELDQIKATEVVDFLYEWFVNHTLHEDMLIAEFQRNPGEV